MKLTSLKAFMVLTAATLFLSACGGGGGSDSNSAQGSKSVFSLWHSGTQTLDFSGGQFSSPLTVYWGFQNGAICSSTILIVGNNSAGSWVLSNAALVSGSDPGCSQINGSGTYANDGTNLQACRTGATCTHYN